MSLGPVIRAGAEPILKRVFSALRSPAVPEAIARGTAEAPAVLEKALSSPEAIGQRGKGIPFTGVPELETATRATEVGVKTLEDRIQDMKTIFGSFFRADPNLPKDVQRTFLRGRTRGEAARVSAELELQKVYEPLQTDAPTQAAKMYDFLVTSDEVAQAFRGGKPSIHGQPTEKWVQQLDLLEPQVKNDPEIATALERRQNLWDRVFGDMLARGWIVPEHYLEDYTPIRKLHAVAQGLASEAGEELRSKVLNMMQHRTNAPGLRETNLVILEKEILGEYMKKVAEHEAFIDLLADKTINFTDQFKIGDTVPHGLSMYRPGPGMIGYSRKTSEGYLIDGLLSQVKPDTNELLPGTYVVPSPIALALETFYPKRSKGTEHALYRAGQTMARWLTVYNPSNTNLNLMSDLPMAMFVGLPGEKAQPLGVFKWWMKAGLPIATKGAFGKKGGTLVEINGQIIDAWDLAQREGVTEGTIHYDVGARGKLSEELSRLMPQGERPTPNPVLDVLSRSRLAIEAAPRIAAGLEAFERTGDISQFGRVGREITLTYGAGAPKAARLPAIRMISPFLQFIGLASSRVMDNLRTPGSRARTIAGIVGVPVLTYLWNSQNEEYKQVENSLAEWERSQAHIIVPDPKDPLKVRRDINGKPVVFRFRYSVPEEVMKAVGLGNIAARVGRVITKRDTPLEFIQSIPGEAAENIADLLTMPGLVRDVATGKTRTGKEMKWPEVATRMFPIARPFFSAKEALESYGPKEAVKTFASETAGVRFATVGRRGKHVSDADLMAAKGELAQTRSRWRTAMINGPPSKAKEAKEDFYKAKEKLERIIEVYKESRKALKEDSK